jgi:gamma-glutamyltranspeptidase/glutathione hydrolase
VSYSFPWHEALSLTYLDFRETAPAAAFEDMYKDNTKASVFGGLASGVPGDIKGLEYLHKKYGVSATHLARSAPLTTLRNSLGKRW